MRLVSVSNVKKLCLLTAFFLCGCEKISEERKAALLKETADAIELLHTGEYEALTEKFSLFYRFEGMEELLEKNYEEAFRPEEEYQGMEDASIMAVGDHYQVRVILRFESYKTQYTVSFDENCRLTGIYFR